MHESLQLRLEALHWQPYRIPFRAPFRTAHGVLTARTGAIIEVVSGDGTVRGSGEIAPLPPAGSHSLAAALAPLLDLRTRLQGERLSTALEHLYAGLAAGWYPASTVYGLEVALLDALGQALGRPLLGNQARRWVAVNAVIGGATLAETIARARRALAAGFSCLKLKLESAGAAAIERVAAVRAAVGPAVALRLDANEGWRFEEARELLTACAPYQIEYVEQPLPVEDLEGLRRLRRSASVAIAVDEAITDLESARRVLRAEAADVLIVKPQFAGGLQMSARIIAEAQARSVACVITSALEAGIGVTAALHLAASRSTAPACGLATLPLLAADLLTEALTIQRGRLRVPDGAGLGVTLDSAALARYALRSPEMDSLRDDTISR